MTTVVALHPIACVSEKVIVGLVVGRTIIRVDRRLHVVGAEDEVVVDMPVRRDDARFACAEGSDVRDTIPTVPRPVV